MGSHNRSFWKIKSPTPNGMGDQVEFGLLLHTTEQPSGDIHKAERIIFFQMDELWNSTRPIRL
jgi:hypothetical protein